MGPVWKLYDQSISLNQLLESAYMLCWAAKYVGEKKIYFRSTFHDGQDEMVREIHRLLNECDAVLTYNGKRFDVPHLNREFKEMGLGPPAPYKHIDLYQTVRSVFKFPSNKLAYVADRLGVGRKMKHEGHELWVKCMENDVQAWGRMKRYNIQDARLNEALYQELLPWISKHPSYAAFTGERVCPNCGGAHLVSNGYRVTGQTKYVRLQCQGCGAWSRLTQALSRAPVVGASDG